jgi:hypothetical protein
MDGCAVHGLVASTHARTHASLGRWTEGERREARAGLRRARRQKLDVGIMDRSLARSLARWLLHVYRVAVTRPVRPSYGHVACHVQIRANGTTTAGGDQVRDRVWPRCVSASPSLDPKARTRRGREMFGRNVAKAGSGGMGSKVRRRCASGVCDRWIDWRRVGRTRWDAVRKRRDVGWTRCVRWPPMSCLPRTTDEGRQLETS